MAMRYGEDLLPPWQQCLILPQCVIPRAIPAPFSSSECGEGQPDGDCWLLLWGWR